MQDTIDIREIDPHPESVSATLSLPSGEGVRYRPLGASDGRILGDYFVGLSPKTVELFRPHDFDQATADRLCAEIDSSQLLRMVAIVEADGQERVIGYFLLRFAVGDHDQKRFGPYGVSLEPGTDCTIAPSVADDYQDRGLGSQLFSHLIEIARRAGRKRIILQGGVRAINARAFHFYKKHGFRKVGEFEGNGNNYDMILEL